MATAPTRFPQHSLGLPRDQIEIDRPTDPRPLCRVHHPLRIWGQIDCHAVLVRAIRQRLGIKLEVIEALLNHISGTRSDIVVTYQRHQYEGEMREAVQRCENWFAAHIAK